MKQFVSYHRYSLILGLIVFLIIYFFFSQVHPVFPYDADDWTYLHNWKDIYPSTARYNPTRILPEFLMPLCGEISMVIIYPFVQDITISVCIASSLFLASAITLYILLFYRLLHKRFCLKKQDSLFLSLLFLAFHFFFFLKNDWENDHLFHSFDLCCHFNYTLPNLFASSFVLYFITESYKKYSIKANGIKQGIFLLGLYLVILSHVFASIILVAYLGVELLFSFVSAIKKKEKLGTFTRINIIPIFVILLWLVILFFEANGSRASAIQETDKTPLFDSLILAAKNVANMFRFHTNLFANFILLCCYSCFFYISLRNHKYDWHLRTVFILLVSFTISCVYLVLMGAVSYPYYLLRLMTLFAAPFFILLGGFFCFATIIQYNRTASFIVPILLLLIFSKMQRDGGTFQDIQTLYIKQEIQGTYKVSRQDILKQNDQNIQALITADLKGIKEPNLIVPKYSHYDNWPIANYYGLRLARFLYKYGLISAPLKVTITPEESYEFEK